MVRKFTLKKLLYGAAYYNEYHPYERLEDDFELMSQGQLSVLRVGESVWGTWEPSEGIFNLEWLQPILDKAHTGGISVIIGTPTYAVPTWLFKKYPEIVAQNATGRPIPFGHRQNVDYSHPIFLEYAEIIIRKIVERYKDHPAVIGWQVDNEPGTEIFFNDGVFESFKKSLEKEYGDIENLNKVWGLTYWSHRLNNYDELWRADGNTNPSYNIAWRKHQARLTTDFIQWQRAIIRGIVSDKQFITTCVALGRPGQDILQIGEALDITAVNVYYATQDGLSHPRALKEHSEQFASPLWIQTDGASAVTLQADMARAIRQENFLVTETNAYSTGHGSAVGQFPPYPGQMTQIALMLISRGAQMVEYWHWHTLHYGNENYWGGVLGHSLKPARTFNTFKQTSSLINAISAEVFNLSPISEVAMLINTESRWAFEHQPTLRHADGSPDLLSYEKSLHSFHEACFNSDLGVQIIGDKQLPSDVKEFVKKYPIFILHTYYVSDDRVLRFAVEYARAGGHLVVTPRTGYADSRNVIRYEEMPGILREAAGVRYSEYSNVTKPVDVKNADGVSIGRATIWIDGLEVETATEVAKYVHPHFGSFSAITNNKFGDGQVTYFGTFPDQQLGKFFGSYLAEGVKRGVTPTSTNKSVTVNKAISESGEKLYFIFNWGWDVAEVNVPFASKNLGNDNLIVEGSTIRLEPWGVIVIAERNK
jgi:beta-galactosidase